MPSPATVFDRRLLRQRRARAASTLPQADFLVREVAERLAERIEEIRRELPLGLVLGSHGGLLARSLLATGRIGTLITADLAPTMLEGASAPSVVLDEEALPFPANRFDVVVSGQLLHWVNDLPGVLAQLHFSLKPDGLLLLALPGGETLVELRGALLDAEIEVEGGAGPRVSPFLDLRDAGALLQRAGFALPVADLDRIRVSYAHPIELLRDLRAMGETNALLERPPGLRRATLARALQLYGDRHRSADGRVAATFDMLFLTGWKPHPSQQQPLKRGTGRIDLATALRPGQA
jgi:SAM-dependent methyltransferase